MDVVLFGPPKESSSPWKDAILVTLLCMAVTGLFLAYRQNKRSQDHLRKMAADMEGLSKAEEELQDLQLKLQQRELQLDSSGNEVKTDGNENVEVSRLKEEVEVLRNELHRAEVELEDRCWVAPPTLQYWLQMTYELESQIYNAKRKTAEEQFEKARELCEKLKKKRSSLVAAFVSTHGCSFDEVDKSILSAKMALHEVTQDLSERSHRWRQIESLCGLPIIANPGLSQLKSMVRHIGGPRLASSIPAAGFALDTEDTCSDSPTDDQAEVPTFPSRTSGQTSSEKTESTENLVRDLLPPAPVNRLALTYLKRNASSSGLSVSSNPSRLGASRVGPGGKKMIKSFSQGGTGSISNAAVSLDPKRVIDKPYDQQSGIITSISDSSLQAKANSVEYRVHWSLEQEDCSDSTNNVDESTGRVDRSPKSDRSKTVTSGSSSANEVSTETNVDSDCGSSVSDIDNNVDASKKTKKMRRLFTFNRKKEKVV